MHKENRVLELIGRTIKYRNLESLTNLYKSLVRPYLDCCSSVWNPYLNKGKFLLERVQRRFTRKLYVSGSHKVTIWTETEPFEPVDPGRKTQQS